MLQALKLDNAPTQAKVRPGTGSDPGDAAFAGLMAQASMASMTPVASTPPSPDRSAPREVSSQRTEAPEVKSSPKPKEHPSNERVQAEAPSDPDDQAKAAVTKEEAKPADTHPADDSQKLTDPEPKSSAVEAAKVAAQAQVSATPGTPIPQGVPEAKAEAPTAKVEAQPAQPEGQAVKPGIQAAKAEDPTAKTATGVEEALNELSQEFQKPEPAPVKPALTELAFIPKGEIQAPRQGAESIKAGKGEAPALVNVGETETNGDLQAGLDAKGPEKDGEKASVKPLTVELGKLELPLPQVQNQKHTAPPVEPTSVVMAEGVKASQTSALVQAPAVVRQSPVFTQVEGSIRWILQNKVQGAELQLHPESLGRMVIQLRVEGQEVHARLWASEPTSLAVMQDHKAFLESSLKEQGLNLGSFDLTSGNRGNSAQTAPQERSFGGASPNLPPPEVQQEMPIPSGLDSANPHRIEVFA